MRTDTRQTALQVVAGHDLRRMRAIVTGGSAGIGSRQCMRSTYGSPAAGLARPSTRQSRSQIRHRHHVRR